MYNAHVQKLHNTPIETRYVMGIAYVMCLLKYSLVVLVDLSFDSTLTRKKDKIYSIKYFNFEFQYCGFQRQQQNNICQLNLILICLSINGVK